VTQAELILKTLEEHGPLDRDALGELLSEQIPAKSLETVLSTLKNRNKVGRTDAGSWFVTESGEDEAGDGEQQSSGEAPPTAPVKPAKRPYTRGPKTPTAATLPDVPHAYELRIDENELHVHISGNSLDVLAAIVEVARSRIEGLRE